MAHARTGVSATRDQQVLCITPGLGPRRWWRCRRAGPTGAQTALTILDGIIASLGLTIEPVSVAHLGLARDAYLRYGKGRNAAGLNSGDCFSIALAKDSGEPLLFKGGNFTHTDVTPC